MSSNVIHQDNSAAIANNLDSKINKQARLKPFVLKDAPALIEVVFPAQKISFEAQRERKANLGQTLTGLGSYWKGRKPLILVRAIILGCLLPQTDDHEKDLEIFEKLMAFDNEGLAHRSPNIKTSDIAKRIKLDTPWRFFTYTIKGNSLDLFEIDRLSFPIDIDKYEGLSIRWRRNINENDKFGLLASTLDTYHTYEDRAALCKRPEEMDQYALYEPIWPAVNEHLGQFGIEACSHQELVEQLGILRYGHRPRVGDTFCGGGSIPFEAARLGCDVYALDLNPIACMLTWGALNIIGATPEKRVEIEQAQKEVAVAVDREIMELGIEQDSLGNRAKAYLYCLETRCPETGWMVPMLPSCVISKSRNVVAKIIPDYKNKRFDIEVVTGVSDNEMKTAENGTVHDGNLAYELDGKIYLTPIKTIRGDYRDTDGNNANMLRRWEKQDFKPRPDDIFQERLYCIQWIKCESIHKFRKETFFAHVTKKDLEREYKIEDIVGKNLAYWQKEGLVPDMAIESGYNTNQPIRERGWTYWHHLFNARQIHYYACLHKEINNNICKKELTITFARCLDTSSKLTRWDSAKGQDRVANTFSNQALNTLYNYVGRSYFHLIPQITYRASQNDFCLFDRMLNVETNQASSVQEVSDYWITDPPYADAINYEEITEYFIAWLRKNPPPPFNKWTWDSRRALAIKGLGDDFRHGMVDAYKAMTEHMPDNGMQCVMFTHQDTGVWSDMVSIFWASGLQVVSAWYIATETTSELKKGGYVQGTVILMLRKRQSGDRPGFKQLILPEVRNEVNAQIKQMMHLNEETEAKLGTPVFNDSDLQMAGYAAALKVLTNYTTISGEDVTDFALRPRRKNETTVVDEIVQQAAETANSLLVPDGLEIETWQAIHGIQRFYLRMMDMETSGASKLDNYQNFAKAFRVEDYAAVMASIKPNASRLKTVMEFKPRDLTDHTEIGSTSLGALFIAIQEFIAEKEPEAIMANLRDALVDYLQLRPVLVNMAEFIATKAKQPDVRRATEALASRIRHQRLQ